MSGRARARSSGHGGARRGSGRKAGALPLELANLLPDITEVLKNPIRKQRYVSDVLTLLMDVRVRPYRYGANAKAVDNLAREVRAYAAALSKIVPADIQFQAAQMLRDDEDGMKEDRGPEEEKRKPPRPSEE